MREVRAEEWALDHPKKHLLAPERQRSLRQIFHWVIQTGQQRPFYPSTVSVPITRPLFLRFRISSCQEKAIPGIPPLLQSPYPVWAVMGSLCTDIKKKNTMHHHTRKLAQNQWPCLLCTTSSAVWGRHLCFYTLGRTLKVGTSTISSACQQWLLWTSDTKGWRWNDLMTWLLLSFLFCYILCNNIEIKHWNTLTSVTSELWIVT